MITALVLALSLLSNTGWAEDDSCPEVRLDALSGAMEHVPVTFQGHVGICYGHAAAQMVDAYRFSHSGGNSETSRLSSSLEIAVGITDLQSPKDDFDDGAFNVCPSIHYAVKADTCDEAWVAGLYSAQGVQRSNFTERLRQLQSDVSKSASNANELVSAAEKDFASYATGEARAALPSEDALVKMASKPTFTEATDAFLEPYCAKKPRIEIPKSIRCSESKSLSGKEIFQKIHALLLLKNAQPVAIKMCRNIFEAGHTYVGVTSHGFKKDCQLHWPLVIGQKKIGGKCRFLIRNSFGTDDSGYSKDWLPREHGNLWIDEDTLAANTLEMSFLNAGEGN